MASSWGISDRDPFFHGGYFYYAHLESYEKNFQIGETVEAGQILGFMGNTGYGEEGTSGKFPVHLHLGIYVNPKGKEELSVNLTMFTCHGEKSKKVYILITIFSKYML